MPQRILVVDDSSDTRESLRLILGEAGYEVVEASEGRAALDLASRVPPDLVLTDLVMPGSDGFELLGCLRRDHGAGGPPVIVVSGFPDAEQEALDRGAALFLPKPVDPGDLVSLVGKVLGERSPEAAEIAEARKRAVDSRRKAGDAAARLVEDALSSDPDAAERARRGADWVCRFFGFGSAMIAIAKDYELRMLALAGADRRLGEASPEVLRRCRDIMESGSSLVMTDTAAPRSLSLGASSNGLSFFAGVPLVAMSGERFGVLCLASARPHAFDADDLAILEHLGRRVSARYGCGPALLSGPVFSARGLLSAESFAELLGIELRSARAHGDAVSVAVLGLGAPGGDEARAIFESVGALRLAVGALSPDRLAISKRAASVGRAQGAIEQALQAVQATRPMRGAGVLSVAASGPLLTQHEGLRFASDALARSVTSQRGGAVRFVLQSEPSGRDAGP